MLTSVACSCLRHGRKMLVPVAKFPLVDVAKRTARGVILTGGRNISGHRSARLLIPTPGCLTGWAAARCVSGSAASQGDTDPAIAPPALEDNETFGSFSTAISSRRSFRKSGPDIQDLRYQEHDSWEAEEEETTLGAVRRPGRRNTPYWYFLQCKKLIKDNKLQEAIDLFSRDMLQVERLQPEEHNYTILIGGCGRAGQLKRAFKLYNDMKKRGLTPVDATYTALFNACANSPSKKAGLQQALKLEQELCRKKYPLSTITYHALLKTHAVTNHLQACIHVLREMLQNGHVVTQETFHYLLMSCVTDKDAGFRLALQIWHQMLKLGIRPDSKNYTLLLRTARDCGIGDPTLASRLLLKPDWESQKGAERASNTKSKSSCVNVIDIDHLERHLFIQPDLSRDSEESFSNQESTQLIPVTQKENTLLSFHLDSSTAPNLLDLFEGRKVAVVSLGNVDGASDRLALIGGASGFLEKMEAEGLAPDLRTLTLLADVMEPSYQSLQMLLKVAKQYQVKLDVAFFNSAIRRATRAGDMDAAKSVLSVMRQRNVSVDVQTYGSLALGCQCQKDGMQLLQDMQEAGFRPNVPVFSALIGGATRRLDYVYLKTILKTMRDLEVWPNEVIIRQLEFAAQYPPNYNQYKSRNNYLVHIDGFRGYYQHWLQVMPAQDVENEKAEVQTEVNVPALKEPADGLTQVQRNQRAAARRYYSKRGNKGASTA